MIQSIPDGGSETIRILHVDDEPDLADLAATYLEREDDRFRVETAISVNEGLDRLQADEFDCVISDYNMPGQNGIEFLNAVREQYPDLPFILYTGKGSEEVASDAISAGVTDYLQKSSGTDQYALLANRVRNGAEKAHAEHRAKETRKQYQSLIDDVLDSSEVGTFILDSNFEIVWINTAIEDYFGLDRDAVIGADKRQLIHSDIAAIFEDADGFADRVIATYDDNSYVEEFTCHVVPGEGRQERWLKHWSQPIETGAYAGGRIEHYTDITTQKERAHELERMRDFFEESERLAPLGAWEYDVTGDVVWTEGTRRIHEVENDYEPTVETGIEFYHPTDRDTIQEAVENALQTGESYDVEARIITARDNERWIRTRGKPLAGGGNVRGYIQDITDQKERERALQRQTDLFTKTQEIAEVGAWSYHVQTGDTFLTDKAYEIHGLTPDAEMTPAQSVSFYHPEDRPAIQDAFDRAVQEGESYDLELRLIDADGTRRWVHTIGEPQLEEGTVVRVFGVIRDITASKQRERELQRYETYLEESSDIISVLDDDGTVRYQSPAVERILGYERETFFGQNGFDYVHPDDVAEVYEAFTDLTNEPGGTATIECRYRTADGEWRWLESRGTNRLEHDAINGIVTNNRDITERKARQHELERTNTVLSTLFETLPIGVLAEDPDRNVLAINERLLDLFELQGSTEEFVGADCEQLTEQVSDMFVESEQFVTRINELVTGRESVRNEALSLRNGRTFTRDHEPLKLPDGVGHLWVFRDITELKKREHALQRERDRLDEFAGIVSHDLRNPLSVAEGRLQLAKEECNNEHLDAIETALDRIGRLTEDVLWLAREGRDVGSMDAVMLQDAVDSAWDIVADRAEDAELHYDGDELSTVTIAADDDRLCQFLENVLGNAIEHGGEDVTVTVGGIADGFYIEDDGPGISEDCRDDVFVTGYSTSGTGTGFGLSIVKQIAEAHDWEIRVTERTGGGTRFEITGVDVIDEEPLRSATRV